MAVSWDDVELRPPWPDVLAVLAPGTGPRPAQLQALGAAGVLESRRNLILAAPTNAGKSLVGLLVLLDAIRRGGRALLLEPLRAIAKEKADELEAMVTQLGQALGHSLSVRLTTGDYRLDDEDFTAPPPDHGELVIATPERIEVLMRNSAHDGWVASIRAVCVDEAHLIGTPHRGPGLEHIVTSFQCLPSPPRVALLSASLGDLEHARAWLDPCDAIRVVGREPPLHKAVWELGPNDDANTCVVGFTREVLSDPSASVLVFVYQTRSTERLAAELQESLGDAAGEDGALAYHAQMSVAQRERVRLAFRTTRSRCVVATTALALGVNLPATHVIVRDSMFPGVGPLATADLLQMMGRAGRGERPGEAVVLVRSTDPRGAQALAKALREEALPDLVSSFDKAGLGRGGAAWSVDEEVAAVATRVAAHLARSPEAGITGDSLCAFFKRSLGSQGLVPRLGVARSWLEDPTRMLAYRDDQKNHRLTVLGLEATRAALPLAVAAGVGQLVRDLLTIDQRDRWLAAWRPLDHLMVLEILSTRSPSLRPFSEALTEQVDGWMEAVPARVPMLFREWVAGRAGASRAVEVLGSLGVDADRGGGAAEAAARRRAYLATFRAIVLFERSQGTSTTDLERRWGVTGLEGIEERWRDDHLWLLSGLARILEVRAFYAHLRQEGADAERVRRVKMLLRGVRQEAFELREDLKYCSPLGPVLRGVRQAAGSVRRPIVGVGSIRRLEEAGLRTILDLARANLEDLVRAGIRRAFARQIVAYARRRMQ